MKKIRKFVVLSALALVVGGLTGCSSAPSTVKESRAQAEALRAEAGPLIGEDNTKALKLLNKAIKIDPNYAGAYSNRGLVYFTKKEYDRAIADFTKAIAISPSYAGAYSNRGRVYAAQKDHDRAIADYTKAININPELERAYLFRGISYADKGDYDHAIMDFSQVIKLDPNVAEAYAARGLAYYSKNKDYNLAIADVSQGLKLEPNNKAISDLLAALQKEKASQYDASKFTVIPSNFRPENYTKIDLFDAVSKTENISVRNTSSEELILQALGMTLGIPNLYVSNLVFVSQSGTSITLKTADNVISKTMKINSRSGLTAGQNIRVYYSVLIDNQLSSIGHVIANWQVEAIERL
jgi:tetratricopeptide (TPR) repeat protein